MDFPSGMPKRYNAYATADIDVEGEKEAPTKRHRKQYIIGEQVRLLTIWQQNKHWSLAKAASKLGVHPVTLLGWR
ncbi:hypothetical protein F444_14378 [Phytophthora nicotianae P1976]|uniref:HTH psq-type domain-containing protein n=1 Tax=Phytophthora nicotianae P1976 TaxID=1317066 RepID=A0A080ZQH7_PHYNI|nr:hypothetical protein F444_14378 [Phytophthora nicotianae P1976]